MGTETSGMKQTYMPSEEAFRRTLAARHRTGTLGRWFYYFSIGTAILALIVLFLNVINQAFSTIAVQYKIDPSTLVAEDETLEGQSADNLLAILVEYAPNMLRVIIRDELSQVATDQFTTAPVSSVLKDKTYDPAWANLTINELESEQHMQILKDNLSQDQLYQIVLTDVCDQEVLASWPLFDTMFNYDKIKAEATEKYPDAKLEFKSWLNGKFVSRSMSSDPANAGIHTALLGSLYIMAIVIVVTLPIGVGAAIYLEEYAQDNWLNRLLETNIRNLAGVPSIIYGMLGLAVFARVLVAFTSGSIFGVQDSNGRTIISAALTLSLLTLPIIIINAQEALRAVPSAIREASFGLGATQWQTVWRQVLPASLPGILTGTILSISRAIGETAPLIVVGASTYVVLDPNSPFSKFTALPIQIWQWTARPQAEFRNIAAAAIIVLLVVMLSLNAAAIILRNRYSVRY